MKNRDISHIYFTHKFLFWDPKKELSKIQPFLLEDEVVYALFSFIPYSNQDQKFGKFTNTGVITSHRILTFELDELRFSIPSRFINSAEPRVFRKKTVIWIKTSKGEDIPLGNLWPQDEAPISELIQKCLVNPKLSKKLILETPETLAKNRRDNMEKEANKALEDIHVADKLAEKEPEISAQRDLKLGSIESNFPWTKTPAHLRKNILLHISDDEMPLFIISGEAGDAAGSLVCMADRCILIKSGFWGSFMSDSFGGARVASFYYSDITGIEYNSGILSGVLEILTASYQGTTNKDYWKSGSKNEDSNDPWNLSNTLPLGKTDYESAKKLFDKLRKLIAQAKPIATLNQNSTSIADEISKLASLLEDGLIDESEFKEAKRRLLG